MEIMELYLLTRLDKADLTPVSIDGKGHTKYEYGQFYHFYVSMGKFRDGLD